MSASGPVDNPAPSRRTVLRAGVLGGTALASMAALDHQPARAAAQGTTSYNFNQHWLFHQYVTGSELPGYPDSGFEKITLPHTVASLSWRDWNPATWEHVWIYRKHFSSAGLPSGRVFVTFDGAMVNATVWINGTALKPRPFPPHPYEKPTDTPYHAGGYLPWSVELTGHLNGGGNVLAVMLDSRWLPVPPEGDPRGAHTVDFLQPGGIYRDVTLQVVPEIFLSDVFASPQNVLSTSPSVSVQATIDAATNGTVQVTAGLLDGTRILSIARSAPQTVTANTTTTVPLTLSGILGGVTLWSPHNPKLYTVSTTVAAGAASHTVSTRIGFRWAHFAVDGFHLNDKKKTYKIFGLNRHQLFPYLGMAAPGRLQRRDAEILKNELNCNMVRCSHYPQSPDFLDACDELGIMVWQEAPGWHYVSTATYWQNIVRDNVHDMVIRDRNRPSVIVWGTRLNEVPEAMSNESLFSGQYYSTKEIAQRLDPQRQSTGAMGAHSTNHWAEDVYSFDDYEKALNGRAKLERPLAGLPYFISESVGALDGAPLYRWIDSSATLAIQASLHAQVHNLAQGPVMNTAGKPGHYAGLLGWCAIDYSSLSGSTWNALKTPGVLDTFRVPKPGAAIYRSQLGSGAPVIIPAFFWDAASAPSGPGANSMIATNCDRLEISVGGKPHATAYPDRKNFPYLDHPPVIVDLSVSLADKPGLHVDGYVNGNLVATLDMSADTVGDLLELIAEDPAIAGDGSDATRITFRTTDVHGNFRPGYTGTVQLSMSPSSAAVLVGDTSFDVGTYGGVGGAFLRSLPGQTTTTTVTVTATPATHPALKPASVSVTVNPQPPGHYL